MSSVVIQFKERAKGNVTTPMVLWALAMTVILFVEVVSPSSSVITSGFVVSAILGIYLGWSRRVAAVIIAPFVSWLFAWFPLEVACMIHFGILKGFLVGLLTITFGWVGIGFVEALWIGMVATVVRWIRGGPRSPDVVIIDPERDLS
ncbi:MAG: hypothetical protein HIU84_02395 [Acidobacteria bacterium]|nr:hypothetical protein [Acidobacteriota bacterium]